MTRTKKEKEIDDVLESLTRLNVVRDEKGVRIRWKKTGGRKDGYI